MKVIDVRLVGESETLVRKAAEQAGVQVSTVKPRRDNQGVTLYGSLVVSES